MNRPTEKRQRELPGLMLYTNSRDLFAALAPEQVKRLLLGMLDYMAKGTPPEPQSPEEQVAWAAMRDHIDCDRQRYEKKCLQNQYNRFLREAEKYMERGECPDFEVWMELSEQGTRKSAETLALAYDRQHFLRNLPNTNPNPNPNLIPNQKEKTNPFPVCQIQSHSQAPETPPGLIRYI